MSICYYNGKIILPDCIKSGSIVVEDDRIVKIVLGTEIPKSDASVNCNGMYISPGFIDIHVHGAGGFSFMDSEDAIYKACACHMQHGTTSIIPTTITGSKDELLDFIDVFNHVDLEHPGCARILGLHLEGPYFSPTQAGAQDPRFLRNPQPEEYEEVLRRTNRIRRWSFAIELDGSDQFLECLHRHHIITSLAHSDANCQQVVHAHNLGLSCLTHFYSCMSTVKRENAFRIAGAIEAGYLLDELFVEAIADGKHLPAELLKLIYKIKGPAKVCLVTDSISAAGMPDGEYMLGGVPCIKEDGVAKLMDRSAFAGSVATMDMLVRTFRQLTDAPLHDVVRMVSLTPAELMKINSEIGSIEVGKKADILVFDETINIFSVMINGQWQINKLKLD